MPATEVLLLISVAISTGGAQLLQPTITLLPDALPVGSSVTLNCSFSSPNEVKASAYWLRIRESVTTEISADGALLFSSKATDNFNRVTYSAGKIVTGSNVTTFLKIDHLSPELDGRYQCKLRYLSPQAFTASETTLTVNNTFQVLAVEGDTFNVTCDGVKEVISDSHLGTLKQISWSHGESFGLWANDSINSTFDPTRVSLHPEALIITGANFSDRSYYTCSFVLIDAADSSVEYIYNRTILVTVRTPPAPLLEKPVLVNTTSASLFVQWKESSSPYKEKATYYVIRYWTKQQQALNMVVNTSYVNLTALSSFMDYSLFVIACNEIDCAAASPTSDLLKTKAAVPKAPIIPGDQPAAGASYIVFKWKPPLDDPSPMLQYNVSWRIQNSPNISFVVKNVTDCQVVCSINASSLESATKYEFSVFAINEAGQGPPDKQSLLTDAEAPDAPGLDGAAVVNGGVLRLTFTPPKCRNERVQCVDSYQVRYRLVNSTTYAVLESKELEGPMIVNITAFEPGGTYEVEIAGMRRALSAQEKVNIGAYSNVLIVTFGSHTDKNIASATSMRPVGIDNALDSPTTTIVATVVPIVAVSIIVAVLAVILVKRRKKQQALENEDQEDFWIDLRQPLMDDQHKPYEENEYECVATNNWSSHVADMHADSDLKFAQEYETIGRTSGTGDLKCVESVEPNNRAKNRYNNILAYDHTRVVLKSILGEINSDYINANFVDSYDKIRQFIATQGPLPNTIDDFWRMVWEQNTAVIVMITNVYEKGRKKCEQYWPVDGEATYASIHVKLLKEDTEELAFWTQRRFLIQSTKIKKKQQTVRYVTQYHYTDWPDHGTPEYSLPVLGFVRQACLANPQNAGPIVVHCSAGVGRSGTFIILESMMKQIDQKHSVNVQGFLRHVRSQRNFLVQTEDQYIFIHDALLDYIQSGGHTEIKPSEIVAALEHLSNFDSEGETNLEKQYKHVVKWRPREYLLLSSKKEANRIKNRSPVLVPVDNSSRVKLPIIPGVDGSDYINASYLHGYFQNQEYIITQHPLTGTKVDFWRMIWDQNSWTIVLLSSVGEEDMLPFWRPKGEATDWDGSMSFRVTFTDENHEPLDYATRDFLLESKQDDYEMKARMFSITYWPETYTVDKVFDFIEIVNNWHSSNRNQAGPIVVIDKFGGKVAATFCALSTLYNQFYESKLADVYSLAYVYHQKRPGVWESEADYHYLYKALATLSEKVGTKEDDKGAANGNTGSQTAPYAYIRRMPSLPRSPGGHDRTGSLYQHSA